MATATDKEKAVAMLEVVARLMRDAEDPSTDEGMFHAAVLRIVKLEKKVANLEARLKRARRPR